MTRIERLYSQHEELVNLVTEMVSIVTKDYIQNHYSKFVRKFLHLLSEIRIHLSLEDKILYPKLLNHENEKIRILAREFSDEMGGIIGDINTFKMDWVHLVKAPSNLDEFIKNINRIFNVLGSRIKRENEDLFPLIENESNTVIF